MKTLVILLTVLGLCACDSQADKYPNASDRQQYFVHYYKDKRTGVCFAGNGKEHLDHDHSHLSAVQCTPDIERLVEDWPVPSN
jgi:hypothetical protein